MTLRKELRRGDRRAAFTLMEVLVVVAILVVLAGVGVPLYLNYLENAKKDIAKTTATSLGQACQSYAIRYGSLPDNLRDLLTPPNNDKAMIEEKMLHDPWGKEFTYQQQGQYNGAMGKPDISTTAPDGTIIGNFETNR